MAADQSRKAEKSIEAKEQTRLFRLNLQRVAGEEGVSGVAEVFPDLLVQPRGHGLGGVAPRTPDIGTNSDKIEVTTALVLHFFSFCYYPNRAHITDIHP